MIVKLLTEHHVECPSLTGGCRGSSDSTLVKMSNCWKAHAAAHIICIFLIQVQKESLFWYMLLIDQLFLFQLLMPRGYTTFFMLNSTEHEISTALKHQKYRHIKKFSLVLSLSDIIFIMLINV